MTPPTSLEASRWLWRGALLLLIGIGVIRIASTYRIFNHTYDEPAHLACGIEWLDLGTYGLEVQHPPLARIFVGIGPYLNGSRSFHNEDLVAEGSSILYDRDYWRTLTLARIGMLPFFVLLCLMVWFWTKHLLGKPAALVAVLLVSNIPPILGHAGVATTDIGVAAMLTAALYTLTLYLENPSARRAGLLGLTIAGAVMAKFSSVAFFPVSLAGFILLRALWHKRFRLRSPQIGRAHV